MESHHGFNFSANLKPDEVFLLHICALALPRAVQIAKNEEIGRGENAVKYAKKYCCQSNQASYSTILHSAAK